MPKYARPTSYDGRQSSKNLTGATRAANATEAAAGTNEQLYISPATLASAVGDLVPSATTAIEGVVLLTDNNSPVATKFYVDAIAIAGAPAWSESVSGIGQLSTNAEALAVTNDNTAMTPLKVGAVLAAPPAIGSGTPAAGSFSTLGATGAVDFDAGGSWESGGAAIDIGADVSADAINLGTGAAARVVTIGNVTGASQVVINSGTAGIQLASTGAGDITINSDDTLLLDADGVLELNSSAGVIGIGNDADAFNINVGTGAAARVITMGNNTGATQLVLEAGSGGLDIGTAASAQSITIGNITGASAIAMLVGSGNFSLDGVAASTYNIGASTTTGTITIGGTAQTGLLSIGDSSGAMTIEIGDGEGATQIDIGGGGTAANDINIAGGAVASTVNIGSASAGAIAVDTAAGVSIDAATASNFSVSGASEDLTLASAAGKVVLTAGEDVAQAILIQADGGISETIVINVDQGTGASSLELSSDVGGVTVSSGLASADAINLSASAGGVDVDGALQVNIASSQNAADAIRINASAGGIDIDAAGGAAEDISIVNAAGSIFIQGGENDAACVLIEADGGTSERVHLHADQGTGVDSIFLESDVGGLTLSSGLASADAINLSASAGGVDVDGALQVNIASSQAAAGAITLSVSNASGGITHTGKCIYTPDAITSDNAGVAASVSTFLTQITTDGDSNEDNVTLADGVDGQIKVFAVVAAGNAADSVKITPANMAGGSKITFAADPTGLGCMMAFDGTNWTVVSNNGGTIA